MDWHKAWDWIVAHKGSVSLGGLVALWGIIVKARQWILHRWYDAPILKLIESQNVKWTLESIQKAFPNRSPASLENTLKRLLASGQVYGVSGGYVSSAMHRLDEIWKNGSGP
jgi:hypothetical protein